MRKLAVATCLFLTLLPASQAAEDRFCVAFSFANHVTYITDPFISKASQADAEAYFATQLHAALIAFDAVQCPVPARLDVTQASLATARTFNARMGFSVRTLRFSENRLVLSRR